MDAPVAVPQISYWSVPNLHEEFKKTQLQWAKGDLNAFSKSFLISDSADDSPEDQRLLGDRDKNMRIN
ncbi:hypothetical protein D3C74_193270 [compost metagenome]